MDNQQHIRLAEARTKAGFRSAKEAADTFHWSYSTYASHENGVRGLRMSAAQRYARAFNVSPDWLLFGNDDERKDYGGYIPVAFRAAVGVWLEIPKVGPYDEDTVLPRFPLRNYPGARQYAVKVEGAGADKVLPDNCYAIAADIETYRPPQNGDLVVFRRDKGEMMEMSIKRYSEQSGKIVLIPETTDPRLNRPIEFEPYNMDGTMSMQILAIVIGAVLLF